MKYVVYLDESGTQANSACLIIGGYVAQYQGWIEFEADWRGVLNEYDLPFFHMTDYSNRAPPYTDWDETRRQECFRRLASIIDRHAYLGFGLAIRMADFGRVVDAKACRVIGGAYGLATIRSFFEIGDAIARVDPAAEIEYVLDDGAKGRGQILKIYDLNKGKPDLRIASLQLVSKERFVPLQAADILAYELYREYSRQLGQHQRLMRRSTLEPLMSLPVIGGVMTEGDIATWAQIANVVAVHNPDLTVKRARQLARAYGDDRRDGSSR